MSNRQENQDLQLAFSLHRSGKLDEAAKLYRKIIKRSPGSVDAFHSLGLIEAAQGNRAEAGRLMARSLLLAPTHIPFIENYATFLYRAGDYEKALDVAVKGCSLDSTNKHLLYVSASSLLRLRRLQESLGQFDRLLSQDPNHLAALNEHGIALMELQRYDAALDGFEKAIVLNPQFAEAHANKGVACAKLERHDEAVASFQKTLALNPRSGNVWLGYGNSLSSLRRYDEALGAYDRALSLDADREAVWLGRGNVLFELGRFDEVSECYDKALALAPRGAQAWLGLGDAFRKSQHYEKALSAFDKALAIDPVLANAWLGRGSIFYDLAQFDEAFAAFDRALTINPDSLSAEIGRLNSKLRLCRWDNLPSDLAHLVEASEHNKDGADPLTILGTDFSAEEQLEAARRWVQRMYPSSGEPLWKGDIYQHPKIRIGYVSADFHEHATAYLMAGVFEHHDRSRFDITAISIGPSDHSPMRRRLENAFKTFIDATVLSDSQVAEQMRAAEIDILVDLKGFTRNARPQIFARRPAPIQVNYLGYPGTMGADYIDYILADPVIIPSSQQTNYAEKVVYLPNSYQSNDATRAISDKSIKREEYGLPADAFVFCCFNNSFKIRPDVFDGWMRIMAQVPGSVLWLFQTNDSAAANLRREAEQRGIAAERIIFAKHVPLADHLARQRLADLFLDTLPYNAHTTASDALWAGLPILTRIGDTFAGRVAASLLNAIHLPELIAETAEDYERIAIDLALHREKLIAIKQKLAENRLTTPLFDTELFTRHIEAAYTAMQERHRAGLPPDHIVIPN